MIHNFQHCLVTPLSLPVTTLPNGIRHYTTPEGKQYPSITTLLSELPSPSLEAWRKRKGPTKAEKIAQKARDRGTSLHNVIEQYLKNTEPT
ncbi:MAG: exonuclease, partial [Candidatus Dormibacteria bacterium]